jgi:hypothetical protein
MRKHLLPSTRKVDAITAETQESRVLMVTKATGWDTNNFESAFKPGNLRGRPAVDRHVSVALAQGPLGVRRDGLRQELS